MLASYLSVRLAYHDSSESVNHYVFYLFRIGWHHLGKMLTFTFQLSVYSSSLVRSSWLPRLAKKTRFPRLLRIPTRPIVFNTVFILKHIKEISNLFHSVSKPLLEVPEPAFYHLRWLFLMFLHTNEHWSLLQPILRLMLILHTFSYINVIVF